MFYALIFKAQSTSVNTKIQKPQKNKKRRTESETSLFSVTSDDSVSSTNSSKKKSVPVCIGVCKQNTRGKDFLI